MAAATLVAVAPAPAAAQQFGPARHHPAGDGISALALADFDGDGHLDVLLRQAPDHLALAHGDGRGGVERVTRPAGPALREAVDLDGDALPDLVGVGQGDDETQLRTRLADRRGGFGDVVESPSGLPAVRVLDVAAAEVDGDGATEVVVAVRAGASGAELWVASGLGAGRFGAWWRAGGSPGTAQVTVVPDLDGDGRAEVALSSDGAIWVSPSDPAGGFGSAVEHRVGGPGGELGSIAVGRFAPGAAPSLAVVDRTRSCIALVAPLAPVPWVPCFPTGARPDGLVAADVDGDGDSDLVHGGSGSVAGLLHGGPGGLGAPRRIPLGTLTALSSDPLVGDLDEDGRPDLVVVANLRSLAVLLNTGRPEVALAPARLAFDPRLVGTVSEARSLLVRNHGTWALGELTATLAGPSADEFAVVVDRCRGVLLAPGAACELRVRFQPRLGGERAATLVLDGHAPGLPRRVALTGRGLPGG